MALDDVLRGEMLQLGGATGNLKGIRERKTTRPLCIISRTSKGRGTSITQNKRLWHYRVPAGEDLEIMERELEMGLDEFDKQYVEEIDYPINVKNKSAESE